MRRFSNGQVTAMVIAVCVAILATPVGVMAAVDQVRISDGTQPGDLARVDDGELRVGDGNGPLSVDGRVAADARTALPRSAFHWNGGLADGSSTVVLVDRNGKGQLALTSAVATSGVTTTGEYTIVQLISWVVNAPDWDCSSQGELPLGSVPGINITIHAPKSDTASLTWPTPVVLFPEASADRTSCLVAVQAGVGGAGRHTDLAVTGFWVGTG